MFSFLNKHTAQVGSVDGEILALAFPTQNELPPSAHGYHTNNLYDGFPPIMADSRSLIASWQPEAFINNQILKDSGIKSNWEYRRYLTQNAEKIMRDNFSESANDIGYYVNDGIAVGPPAPKIRPHMGESDLKELYISREELQSRRIAPVLTQDELLRIRGR